MFTTNVFIYQFGVVLYMTAQKVPTYQITYTLLYQQSVKLYYTYMHKIYMYNQIGSKQCLRHTGPVDGNRQSIPTLSLQKLGLQRIPCLKRQTYLILHIPKLFSFGHRSVLFFVPQNGSSIWHWDKVYDRVSVIVSNSCATYCNFKFNINKL